MLPNSASVTIELTSQPRRLRRLRPDDVRNRSMDNPLAMGYVQCLKAFEGAFKEVFVVKKEKEIIGFVIMQTQGTFKGYIQTICIDTTHRGLGYGTKILQFCEGRILRYSPNIFICVSTFNHGAIPSLITAAGIHVGMSSNWQQS